MSRHPDLDRQNLDRQNLQQFLANAFAIQESLIDRDSLTVVAEIRRRITRKELDPAGTMHLIVEAARGLANASGVAVGLLEGDQLVYRAGNGSAASDVERAFAASLTASAATIGEQEIIRVENADEDTRIQAAICRQLGAKSVLILPICKRGFLTGVLEVRFNESHAFQDPEVKTYRLMVALIEDALLQASQTQARQISPLEVTSHVEPRENPAAWPAIQQTNPITPHGWLFLSRESMSGAIHTLSRRWGKALTPPQAITQRAKQTPWHVRGRTLAWAGFATVLALACWIVYPGRGRTAPVVSSAPVSPAASSAPTAAADPQPALPPAKPTAARNPHPVQPTRATHWSEEAVRVVKANEVEYVRGDVTVRYFKDKKPATRPKSAGKNGVAHIGDDVTVRYFPADPAQRSVSR